MIRFLLWLLALLFPVEYAAEHTHPTAYVRLATGETVEVPCQKDGDGVWIDLSHTPPGEWVTVRIIVRNYGDQIDYCYLTFPDRRRY